MILKFCQHYENFKLTWSLHLLGLSSFYSELMKGIGASSRLWQLIDRNPTIPLTGMVSDMVSMQIMVMSNLGFHCFFRKSKNVIVN